MVSVIPVVNTEIFQLQLVRGYLYAIAIGLAFLCMAIDEIYKVKYRRILVKRKQRSVDSTAKKTMNDRVEVIVELLEKHTKWMEESSRDMRELKVHVAELEKKVIGGDEHRDELVGEYEYGEHAG
jgi:hypothetical protein